MYCVDQMMILVFDPSHMDSKVKIRRTENRLKRVNIKDYSECKLFRLVLYTFAADFS